MAIRLVTERTEKIPAGALLGGKLVNYSPKTNSQHNAHDIYAEFVGCTANFFQSLLHFLIHVLHSLVYIVHLIVDIVQHDALSLNLFALQGGDFCQVLNTFTNFV